GTSMPSWKEFLTGDSLRAVIGYIKAFSPRFQSEHTLLIKSPAARDVNPKSIEAGKQLFVKLQCGSCHGADATGQNATAANFKDDWGNNLATPNLTEPWTFRGGSSVAEIYQRMRTGIDGSPMPSYKESASDQELLDLAGYIRSLERKPVWTMNADELQKHYAGL